LEATAITFTVVALSAKYHSDEEGPVQLSQVVTAIIILPAGRLMAPGIENCATHLMHALRQLPFPHFLHHSGNRTPINVEQLGNLSLTLHTKPDHLDCLSLLRRGDSSLMQRRCLQFAQT
jgi:hypothetical protein